MFKTRLDTFGNEFGHVLNFETFLIFLKFLEGPTLHVARGNFFSKKLPQNMFKTILDNFGNVFGPFCNFYFFLIFSKFLDDSIEHWAKNNFQKNRPKTRLDTRERFWTILELWNFLIFSLNFF